MKMAEFHTFRVTLKDGVTTRVVNTRGDKPPLVLIHGLAASIEIWNQVTSLLIRGFRVLAFDLPGFGERIKRGDQKWIKRV